MLDWVDRDGCSAYDNTAARALFGGWQLFAVLCGIVVEQAELAFHTRRQQKRPERPGGSAP